MLQPDISGFILSEKYIVVICQFLLATASLLELTMPRRDILACIGKGKGRARWSGVGNVASSSHKSITIRAVVKRFVTHVS